MTKKNENKGLVPFGVKWVKDKNYEIEWKSPAEIFGLWERDARELKDSLFETEGNIKVSDAHRLKLFASYVRHVCCFIYGPENPRSHHMIRSGENKIRSYDFLDTVLEYPETDYEDSIPRVYSKIMDQLHYLALVAENFSAVFADINDVQNAYKLVSLVEDLAILNSK